MKKMRETGQLSTDRTKKPVRDSKSYVKLHTSNPFKEKKMNEKERSQSSGRKKK
jgi:hypothetical protein